MNDYTQAVELVDMLETLFTENPAPIPNETTAHRIQFLCNRISSYDGYIAEKCGSIEGFSKIFYSDRKHKKYRGGADEVYEFILNDLARIRQRLKNVLKTINKLFQPTP